MVRYALIVIVLCSDIGLVFSQRNDPMGKKDGTPLPDGLKALQHPDYRVRYKAVATLASVGAPAKFAVPELRELLKDKSVLVRVKTAEALWKIDNTPASVLLPVLLLALKDKDATARAAAPAVIALLGSQAKRGLPALAQALGDKEFEVKLAAIAALGELGPVARGTAGNLLDLAKDEDFFLLEPFIGAALSNLGESVVPELAKAVVDPAANRRRAAAYALGSMGVTAAPAVPALAQALKSDDPATRRLAARALGKIGKDARAGLPELERLFADGDPFVRMEAALAAWSISGQTQSVSVLVKALGDESANVRDSACQTLASMKAAARPAVEPLTNLLQDKDLRIQAIITLGEIGPAADKALPELKKLSMDKDGETQLSSAFAIWQITREAKEALPIIEKGLASSKNDRLAIRLLGNMGVSAQSVLPTLVELYRQEDEASYRSLLASTIKKIDPQTAMKLGIR